MARKSRKKLGQDEPTSDTATRWKAAIYARLSVEDKTYESIEHQIELVQHHLASHIDIQVVRIFTDNGETGTSFDRPAWMSLMDAVRKKEINCIVVKDFSRFGRNYLEMGRYLEQVFPFLNVRFLSVNDQFDSLYMESGDLLNTIKSILHDSYARDISTKIKSSLHIRKQSGRFMNKRPLYGYERDPSDRYHLIVNPEQASVVKQIFQWSMDGVGATAIARKLNDMNISSPSRLWYLQGIPEGKSNAIWRGASVKSILENPCYTGCLVERKYQKAHGVRKVGAPIPKEQWNLIQDTHEAIIDSNLFATVSKLLAEQAISHKRRMQTENILGGMVICGCCGGRMQRDSGYYDKHGTLIRHRFACQRKYLKEDGCPSSSIAKDLLLTAVSQVCHIQLALCVETEKIVSNMAEKEQQQKAVALEMRRKYERDIEKLTNQQVQAYGAYKAGNLEECTYRKAQQKSMSEKKILQDKLEKCKSASLNPGDIIPPNETCFLEYINTSRPKTISKTVCARMIHSITVTDDGIKIHFAYQDIFSSA